MMMKGVLLFLTISLLVLLKTAADDTQQQQLETSLEKAQPEVSHFIRQLAHSARRKRSLGFNPDGVFSGLSERNMDSKRHRAEALERRELEEMAELDKAKKGLEDEDEDEDDALAERVAQQAAQHDQAHAALKRIHSAMKQGGAPPNMHKRGNQCSIGGNYNNQWCHDSPWGK